MSLPADRPAGTGRPAGGAPATRRASTATQAKKNRDLSGPRHLHRTVRALQKPVDFPAGTVFLARPTGMDETHSLIAQRRAKLEALRARGVDPFRNKFTPTVGCGEARRRFLLGLENPADPQALAEGARVAVHEDAGVVGVWAEFAEDALWSRPTFDAGTWQSSGDGTRTGTFRYLNFGGRSGFVRLRAEWLSTP